MKEKTQKQNEEWKEQKKKRKRRIGIIEREEIRTGCVVSYFSNRIKEQLGKNGNEWFYNFTQVILMICNVSKGECASLKQNKNSVKKILYSNEMKSLDLEMS